MNNNIFIKYLVSQCKNYAIFIKKLFSGIYKGLLTEREPHSRIVVFKVRLLWVKLLYINKLQ